MVPAHIELVASLPRLTSGKINVNQLRELPLQTAAPGTAAAPETPEEAVLYAALKKLFPGPALQPEADFFDDLGGHSLLAARLVSLLRTDARYAVWGCRSFTGSGGWAPLPGPCSGKRANRRRAAGAARGDSVRPALLVRRRPRRCACRFSCCCTSRTGWGPFSFINTTPGIRGTASRWRCCIRWRRSSDQLANFGVAIAAKRLLTGRLAAGVYPLWGLTYFRWWLAGKLGEMPDVVSAGRHAVDAAVSARPGGPDRPGRAH